MSEPAPQRIFIVEDHPAIQASYQRFIGREPGLAVCGMARRGDEALAAIGALAPDLVIVDLSLPDMDGLDLVAALSREDPHRPVLVVSGHPAEAQAERARARGALAYVDKLDADTQLIPAIRAALAGAAGKAAG
jgi:DNA-binding NarL/FixJ family response regulator